MKKKDPIRRWWERLEYVLLFLAMTVFLHSFISWFQSWIPPSDPYQVPHGKADKVFESGNMLHIRQSPQDRLQLFFWLGE